MILVPIANVKTLNEWDNKNSKMDYFQFINNFSFEFKGKMTDIVQYVLYDAQIELMIRSIKMIVNKMVDNSNKNKQSKFYLWIDEIEVVNSKHEMFDIIYNNCFPQEPIIDESAIFIVVSMDIIPKKMPIAKVIVQ